MIKSNPTLLDREPQETLGTVFSAKPQYITTMIMPTSCRATARLMVWHAQFKTSALANKAGTGANRGNRGRWNFSVLSVPSCSNPGALGIVGPEDTDISTLKPQITGEDKKGGVVEIDFNLANSEGVNMDPESFRGYSPAMATSTSNSWLAAPESDEGGPATPRRPTWTISTRRDLSPANPNCANTSRRVATRPEVVGDVDLSRRSRTKAEVSQFGNEITVNCAPLV